MIGLIAVTVLAACGGDDAWSHRGALAPTLAAMDADGDGRVGAAEYGALALGGPSFSAVDIDRDGAISPGELAALVFTQDPLRFDGAGLREPWSEDIQARTVHPDPYEQRTVRDLLRALCELVRAADPGAALPGEADIEAAARPRRLDSPASRAVLEDIRAAAERAGAALPPRLFPEGAP